MGKPNPVRLETIEEEPAEEGLHTTTSSSTGIHSQHTPWCYQSPRQSFMRDIIYMRYGRSRNPTPPSPTGVDIEDVPRCFPPLSPDMMDIIYIHTGRSRNPDVDSTSFQDTVTSNLTPPTSTTSRPSTSTTKPTIPDTEKVPHFGATVEDSMGRVSKRDYRHRHQTQEFFAYQPTSDQETSEGQDQSTTTPATTQQHLATGKVQNCPGAKECPDCIAGRSTPVGADGSTSSQGGGTRSSDATTAKPGKVSVLKTEIRRTDLWHGLILMEQPSAQIAAKSQTSTSSEPKLYLDPYEIFDCLTDGFRREAADDTIRHLCKKLDLYKFEGKNSAVKDAEGLPFLNEGELIDMINSSKMTSKPLPKPVQPKILHNVLQRSSASTFVATSGDPNIPTWIEPGTSAHNQPSQKVKDSLKLAIIQACPERGNLWANLLIRANRRMRVKWRSEYEAEMKHGPSQGIPPAESAVNTKKIYEAIKAEDEAKLEAKFDADIDYAIELAIRGRLLDEQSTYLEQYCELLFNQYFLLYAKESLKEWCTREVIQFPSEEEAAAQQYRKLVREGDVLPKHAWESTSPPAWDLDGSLWIWNESSKVDEGNHTIPEQSGSKDEIEASKTAAASTAISHATQSGSDDNAEANQDVATSEAVSHEGEEKPATLTKNQKRAKARREKRRAKKAAVETDDSVDAVNTAGDSTTPPKTPAVTDEEFIEALQAAQASVKDSLSSKAGPSTNTETITKNGQTYRVPAPARVNMTEAIRLATSGKLRVSMCPTLGKGDAARLLNASHAFQSEIETENIGKDPIAMTEFLMTVDMKPSEDEQVLELDKYLEIMKKMEDVELDDPTDNIQTENVVADAGTARGKGKGKAKEVTTPTTASVSSAATSYPPPPAAGNRTRHTVPDWSLSLTPAQVHLIATNDVDRWILMRGLLFAARTFLHLAVTSLPSVTFDRLVHKSAGVLSSPDFPVQKYAYARTVVLTTKMSEMYDIYAAEKRRKEKKGKGKGAEVRDYVVEAITPLNQKYETVAEMVQWARGQAGKKYLEEEAMVLAGKEGLREAVKGKEEAVKAAEKAMVGREVEALVGERADGVVRFLARWPGLEGVVVVEERVYGAGPA